MFFPPEDQPLLPFIPGYFSVWNAVIFDWQLLHYATLYSNEIYIIVFWDNGLHSQNQTAWGIYCRFFPKYRLWPWKCQVMSIWGLKRFFKDNLISIEIYFYKHVVTIYMGDFWTACKSPQKTQTLVIEEGSLDHSQLRTKASWEVKKLYWFRAASFPSAPMACRANPESQRGEWFHIKNHFY